MNIKLALGSFFSASAGAIAKRVLVALGVGIITTVGVTVALNNLISAMHTNYNGMGQYVAALAGLGGVGDALGIVCGALSYRIAITLTSRIGVLPK